MVLAARSHELSAGPLSSALCAVPCARGDPPETPPLRSGGLAPAGAACSPCHCTVRLYGRTSKRSAGRHVAPRWGESHPWIGEPWRRSCTPRNLTGLGGPAEDILVGMVEVHPGGTVGTAHRRRRTRTPVVHHNTHLVVRRNTVGVPVDSRGARHSSSSNRAHSCRAMPCRAP